MKILGVDPGLRHLGLAVLEDGRVVDHYTVVPKGRGKIPIEQALTTAMGALNNVFKDHFISYAAVEQVSWYGKRHRVMLPLSHVAGCLVGYLCACGVPSCLLLAHQRRPVKIPRAWRGESWDEHQRDAAALATVLHRHLLAVHAGEPTALPKVSAVARRLITAPRSARGPG